MPKKKTLNEFITGANKKHNNYYDYSKVVYVNNKVGIIIICPIHGEFTMRPDNHLYGNNCNECSEINKIEKLRLKNHKLFLEKSSKIHGDFYDYSLVEYINNDTLVTIICPLHGEFSQTPATHMRGHGCNNYVNIKCNSSSIKPPKGKLKRMKSTEQFIIDAMEIHGDFYDYSLVDYIGNTKIVKIICPLHGEFLQKPNKHLYSKQGCNECGNEKISISKRKKVQDIINQCSEVHDNLYTYLPIVGYRNVNSVIEMICPYHGNFTKSVTDHLYKGQGCQKCTSSKGVLKIMKKLDKMDIYYKTEQTFEGCVNVNKLRFDFYLPDYNICVEFDGEQHFGSIDYFGGNSVYMVTKKCDIIKDRFCRKKGIKLIRIPYYDYNIINNIIKFEIGI